jgi:flagellar hook-associated protein 3 FlgL
MKSTFISTDAITSASRLSMLKLQTKLADTQKEVSTGRLADVGLSLGYKTGQTISLRQDLSRLQTITETNGLVTTRLDATQAALKSLVDNAQSFISQMVAARGSTSNSQVLASEAKDGLGTFIDTGNTAVNGSYLFSGINADVKPLAAYFGNPPTATQQAVASAFQSAFGVTQSDPNAQNITGAQMQSFLDGPFANMFADPAWGSDWSSASDQNVRSRISTSELIETSANANDPAFRKLASAYTMVADLGVTNLNQNAYQAVIDKATALAGSAIQDLTTLQGTVGTAQERVVNANDRMTIQMNIITSHIGALEGVDMSEASTRLSTLLTQIEAAYAMTARIQQMSVLNYLPPPT